MSDNNEVTGESVTPKRRSRRSSATPKPTETDQSVTPKETESTDLIKYEPPKSEAVLSPKKQEIAKRIDRARILLEHRLSTSAAACFLQEEFKISRSQAYADLAEADLLIRSSDDGPSDVEMLDYENVFHTILYAAEKATYRDDYKAAINYINAAEKIKKWIGATWRSKPEDTN